MLVAAARVWSPSFSCCLVRVQSLARGLWGPKSVASSTNPRFRFTLVLSLAASYWRNNHLEVMQ
jgi:hypothetical protein